MKKYRKLNEALDSQLIDELLWGLAYNTGTRLPRIKEILKKYDLDIEATFNWFNNTRNKKQRNSKRIELIGLFTGMDNEAEKIASLIKSDKNYKINN